MKNAIVADEARVVVRNAKQFVTWDTFDDSITQGIHLKFKASASKGISKEMYKSITDSLKEAGLSIDMPQKEITTWNGGKVSMPEKAKEVLKKASMACVKTITECRDIFKELQKVRKVATIRGKHCKAASAWSGKRLLPRKT